MKQRCVVNRGMLGVLIRFPGQQPPGCYRKDNDPVPRSVILIKQNPAFHIKSRVLPSEHKPTVEL